MKSIARLVPYLAALATFTSADPYPQAADSNHIEGNLKKGGNLTGLVACPNGWTPGIDKSEAKYCFNCGLPNAKFLGCGEACHDGNTCAAYAQGLCAFYSDRNIDGVTGSPNCSGVPADFNIFPRQFDGAQLELKPAVCSEGGKSREIFGSMWTYETNWSGYKNFMSDMCGYLLNNCPMGIRDQAVIYNLGDGSLTSSPGNATQAYKVVDNNFTDYSYLAFKLSAGDSCA